MADNLIKVEEKITAPEWGCDFFRLSSDELNVYLCLVEIKDLDYIAEQCIASISDDAWMNELDPRVKRSYSKTAQETAKILQQIFSDYLQREDATNASIGSDFGEIMVSLGSSGALSKVLSHKPLPVAELWKPQIKQNEGFDFHTECNLPLINFGEAKFSGVTSPHGEAIPQIKGFITDEKHFRDRVHLVNIASSQAVENLDEERFGVIAAFSINAKDPLTVMANALKSSLEQLSDLNIEKLYLVGVVQK